MQVAGRDNFSYEGMSAILEYYENFEEDYEFDPVAIDSTWVEYDLNDVDQFNSFLQEYERLIDREDLVAPKDDDEAVEAIIDAIDQECSLIYNHNDKIVFDGEML
jgi:hypothetical protein